jgi:hypothetical protein
MIFNSLTLQKAVLRIGLSHKQETISVFCAGPFTLTRR